MRGPAKTTYTTSRHDWLRRLASHPGSRRSGSGACAFSCRQLGWTVWDGKTGEQLTDEGRAILARWDKAAAAPTPPAPLQPLHPPVRFYHREPDLTPRTPLTGLPPGYETVECEHDIPLGAICDEDHRRRD